MKRTEKKGDEVFGWILKSNQIDTGQYDWGSSSLMCVGDWHAHLSSSKHTWGASENLTKVKQFETYSAKSSGS